MSKATNLIAWDLIPYSFSFGFQAGVMFTCVGSMNETMELRRAQRLYRVDVVLRRNTGLTLKGVPSRPWVREESLVLVGTWSQAFASLRARLPEILARWDRSLPLTTIPFVEGDQGCERIIRAFRSEISHRPSYLRRGGEV